MSYVIVNVATKQAYSKSGYSTKTYETERGAKGACTKMNYKSNTETYEVMTAEAYQAIPVEYEMVQNLMTGKMVKQAKNTPRCCDVSSELYFSM
jgi:hypothetical protein